MPVQCNFNAIRGSNIVLLYYQIYQTLNETRDNMLGLSSILSPLSKLI